MKYLVNISYDGSNFYGSSIQKNKRTVCGILESNISKILNTKTKITACSRTDRKVHANNFYFHFETNKELNISKFKKSLNSLIDKDIYIKSVEEVPNNFHARYNVVNKEYLYIINQGEYSPVRRNYELEYNKKINVDLLKKASTLLLGTHDFKSFTSDNEKTSYIRNINYIKIEEKSDLILIYINANGFLKYMVRNIIGLLLEINEGKKQVEDIPKILNGKNRQMLGIKAEPNGLYLNIVNYE